MTKSLLSTRGAKAAHSPARVDFELYFEATQDLYDRVKNPNGKFPLNVAEQKLNWDTLEKKIREVYRENDIPAWVSQYGDPSGVESFREAVAWYLGELLFKTAVDPNHLAVSSGLTSVIEQTAFVLTNPGDVAVIPAPSYPVYTGDLGVKSGVERYDLITHEEISALSEGLPLGIQHLEDAKNDIEQQGKRMSMLILTTPDNPTGSIYSEEQLASIAHWCINHQVHLIINEIYGLSIIDTQHPDIASDYDAVNPFVSSGKLLAELHSPFVHLWYSFSKDFGVSGFRVGLVHTHNEEFIQAYRNINLTHGVSNLTQWTLQKVLEDRSFVTNYLQQNQALLTASYATVAKNLRSHGINYVPSRGSLFIWIDLSHLVPEQTASAEEKLWLDIYHQTGILLTPPAGFGHTKKGLFRMVITYYPAEDMQVVMDRLVKYVGSQ